MIFFTNHETPVSKLVQQRAQLLVATRDLLYADAEMMEDFGNSNCDYCTGGDEDVPDGHDLDCPFANAFEIILEERAQGEGAIRQEALDIRDALVMLVATDFSLMGVNTPCDYCGVDNEHPHTDSCVFNAAVDILETIKRSDLI